MCNFGILITMCHWCGPLWVHNVWDPLCFLDLYVYFLYQVREVFCNFFSNRFSLFSLPFFWHPCDMNVDTIEVVPQAPYSFLRRGIFFTFFCSYWVLFASFYSKLLIWFLASSTLLLVPYKLLFILVSVSFISDWSFFMLLKFSVILLRSL